MFVVLEPDRDRLARLEKTVDKGLKQGIEAFKALKEIRDDRLYNIHGFNTFEDYVRKIWSIERGYAYRMIAAAECQERIVPLAEAPEVSELTTEGQLRELIEVPDDFVNDVIEEAANLTVEVNSPRITANILRKARKKVLGKPSGNGRVVSSSPSLPTKEDLLRAPEVVTDLAEPEVADPVAAEPAIVTDPVAERAIGKIPDLIKSLRLQLGHIGLGGKYDTTFDSILADIQGK